MSVFDTWVAVQGLKPGKQYRCLYKVVCFNTVASSNITLALAETGIITANPDVSRTGLGSIANSEMHFGVNVAMSITEFIGKLQSAFDRASQNAVFECTTPEIEAVEELSDKPLIDTSTAFGGGAVLALIVIAAVVILVWRVR